MTALGFSLAGLMIFGLFAQETLHGETGLPPVTGEGVPTTNPDAPQTEVTGGAQKIPTEEEKRAQFCAAEENRDVPLCQDVVRE